MGSPQTVEKPLSTTVIVISHRRVITKQIGPEISATWQNKRINTKIKNMKVTTNALIKRQ